MKHKTTKEHYEKYKQKVEDAHIYLDGHCLGYDKEYLQRFYDRDPILNNIPLHEWDQIVYAYWHYQGKEVIQTLAEGVCAYKHAVVYQLLGAEPEFTDG